MKDKVEAFVDNMNVFSLGEVTNSNTIVHVKAVDLANLGFRPDH